MATGYDIRLAVLSLVQAANLPGIPLANIKNRMITKVSEGLDALPAVIISPYGTLSNKPADFGGGRDWQFRVRIAMVDATGGDAETNQELYEGWLQSAMESVLVDASTGYSRDVLPGVAGNWEINAENATTFDDSKLGPKFYAFLNAVLRFEVQR